MISKLIASILPYFPQKFIWLFSKKYVAGETIEQAIDVALKLNKIKIDVTIDLLGEFIKTMEQATYYKNQYLNIITTFENANIKGSYSLKPSSFGLLIDKKQCYNNIREIIILATKYNNFVRIDMEDSKCVDLEIDLYNQLRDEFPKNVGLVLQAYLLRTRNDIDNMLQKHNSNTPLNFRLCKGIYIESEDISIKNHNALNQNYLYLLDKLMKNNVYVGIATHDIDLIKGSEEIISRYNVTDNMYEYQMLYGVTPILRNQMVNQNKKMRVYIPYGKDWFNYSIRRLKENPNIVKHIFKSLFIKK